jgi:hypothetical protein
MWVASAGGSCTEAEWNACSLGNVAARLELSGNQGSQEAREENSHVLGFRMEFDRRLIHLHLDGEHVVLDVPFVRPTKGAIYRQEPQKFVPMMEASGWITNIVYDASGGKILDAKGD